MAKYVSHQPGASRRTKHCARQLADQEDGINLAKARILAKVSEMRRIDPDFCRALIRERQERDMDKYDEVWDGVYVVPALPTNPHQDLVTGLSTILYIVIALESRGRVQAGANVSDRRSGWDHNFRGPDVVVVLNESRAIDCTTHWFGGPDFLIEARSPGDESYQKIPFYSKIQVGELLIIHRDTRQLQLYRHNGQELVLVDPIDFQGGKWLVSQVVPLAFRRKMSRTGPRTEVRRTDGKPGQWVV